MSATDAAGTATGARPVALEVAGFRGWRAPARIALDASLSVFVGENAAGKSSTLNAIEWCLFGSDVAKKASGIDERADWDVVARSGAVEARVALDLATSEGVARLERARAKDAKVRDPDRFTVTLPSGDVLEGDEEVASWWAHHGLPDWTEWKQAFCQHQERARGRVLDASDRSVQLGRLLGLEPYQDWTARWKALRPKDLEKEAQAALDAIEADLERAAGAPRREADRLAEALERRGVARVELSTDRVRRAARDLARAVHDALQGAGLAPEPVGEPESVDEEGARAVVELARDLPRRLEARRRELTDERRAVETARDELARAITAREPADRAWRDAKSERERHVAAVGSSDALREERERLQADRRALDEADRAENALAALLRDARAKVAGDDCPVCEQAAPDLARRLDERLAALADEGSRARAERRRTIVDRAAGLDASLKKHDELRRAEEGARDARERAAQAFLRAVPAGVGEGDAQNELDRLRRDADARRGALERLDALEAVVRDARDLTEQLAQWGEAHARAEAARGELDDLPAWRELQDAIDEAAGLARDVEVLERWTRDLQERRSTERVREVNASIGAHYAAITGADEDARVQVRVKATAARLSYELVDGSGDGVLPVLNQAALNALSLAVLFAQAEHRARSGRAAWVVLDDPEQNLDPRSQRGLADALRSLSARVPAIVACFDGALGDALSRADGARVFRLHPGARGVSIEEDAR